MESENNENWIERVVWETSHIVICKRVYIAVGKY